MIEARTGNAALGTQRGDIVVAGSTINAAGNQDGVLFRTRSDGSPIWHRRYNALTAHEVFRALTETLPVAPNPAGDIVAVGHLAWPGAPVQGYAVRVNGNDGLFGGPGPKVAVRYGVADQVVFESVVELRQPGFTGALVIAGNTRSTATGSDMVLVRTTSNPAVPLAQRRIGDPAGGTFGEEVALDVHEVTNALAAASPGSLALTGRLGRSPGVGFDAFLMVADRLTLRPSGAIHLYGDHADRLDSGVSVSDHAAGFVLAGFSSSDFAGVGDPRDVLSDRRRPVRKDRLLTGGRSARPGVGPSRGPDHAGRAAVPATGAEERAGAVAYDGREGLSIAGSWFMKGAEAATSGGMPEGLTVRSSSPGPSPL